jgi:PAS domain S-box-containing protein
MSTPLEVEQEVLGQDTLRAALIALAGEEGAPWVLCDSAGRALLVGAGAGALLTAHPSGEAFVLDALTAAIRGPEARVVSLGHELLAKLTRLGPGGDWLVKLIQPSAQTQAERDELLRLTTSLSGDFWAIFAPDGTLILLNEAARAFEVGGAEPLHRPVWELMPAISEARWTEWMAELNVTDHLRRDVVLSRPGRPVCQLRVELVRDSLAGRPVVRATARALALDAARERELRERRAADALLAEEATALARCADDELDDAVAQVLTVLGEHLGVRELRVLRCVTGGPVVGLWSWGDPDHSIPVVSATPPTHGIETTLHGDAVRMCAVISDGGSHRGYLKALWSSVESHAQRPLTTETLLASTAELLGRTFARIDSAEAIRKYAESFRDFVNNLPGLAFRSEINGFYSFTMVSEGARALTGFTPEQLLGRSFLELVHPDDREHVIALCIEQERVGDRFEMEYRIVTADERERWVWSVGHKVYSADGTPLYSEGLLTDVTERRQVERERDLFFTSAQDAMAIVDGAGQIQRGNAAFWELFGVKLTTDAPSSTLLSRSSDPQRCLDLMGAALSQLSEAPHFGGVEGHYVTADGRERWVSWSGVVVHQPETRIYIVGHDITRRQVEEEERRILRERLAQMERLEALGILAGGLAHDLNNVMGVALGSLALINSGSGLSDGRSRHIARVEGALERGSRIIDQLLSFGRRQVSQRAPTDLNSVVAECSDLARSSAPADVQITLDATSRSLAWADAGQIEQVVMNLIMNALDAMPQGGQLCVATEDRALSPQEAKQHDLAPGSYVMLRVQDDGVGIAEELREQIFDPFFTTKSTGKGLGLSSAYGIVRAHDGALRVRAGDGGGSVFEVFLPVSPSLATTADAPAPAPSPATDLASSVNNATVLLVEDNLDLQETVALVLESVGLHVRLASSAEEGRRLLSEGPVDLLLTDVVMPGESGVSLARHAQCLYPGQRTVFMSGYAWNELVKGRSMPADALFLRKPFTNEALKRVVTEALLASQTAPAPS